MSVTKATQVPDVFLKWSHKVGPIRCIYDCGSRDATDGLSLLTELDADELHAFECNPEALELCKNNISLDVNRAKVHLVPCALAETSGVLKFHSIDPTRTITSHPDGNIGASSLYRANPEYPHEHYVQKTIDVTAISLDEYSVTHTLPDLLWMDLQGAEARVLDGAKNILPRVKIIHVEVSFRRMYIDQALFRDVHLRLRKNFRLVWTNLGRWPSFPRIYSALRFGPWLGNAIYVNKTISTR